MPNPATPDDPRRIALAVRLVRPGFTLDVKVDLPGTGVTALFGRSGAGKTTVLRILAGLESARGQVRILGETCLDSDAGIFVPTHRRAIGYVFQEPSLFAHLSVRGNLDYAHRRSRGGGRRGLNAAVAGIVNVAAAAAADHAADASGHQIRLDAVISTLRLAPLLGRAPGDLSGGERQRVAIARALLASPRLLLMDEPVAALDASSRAEIFPVLGQLRDVFGVPIVYVSHALDEIARLADHVVVLEHGAVRASGPVAEVLSRLELSDVFSDDAGVVVDGVIGALEEGDRSAAEDRLSRLDFDGHHLWVTAAEARPAGSRARARVLARDVSLALQPPGPSSILNTLPATVVGLADSGAGRVTVRLSVGHAPTPLLAWITRRSCAALGLRPGLVVYAQVKTVALLA